MMEAGTLASNAVLSVNARMARLIMDARPDSFTYLPTYPFFLKRFFHRFPLTAEPTVVSDDLKDLVDGLFP